MVSAHWSFHNGIALTKMCLWWMIFRVNVDYGGVYIDGTYYCVDLVIRDDDSSQTKVEAIATQLLNGTVDFLFAPYVHDVCNR